MEQPPPPPSVPDPSELFNALHAGPPPGREKPDERCFTNSRQTNKRRAAGFGPRVSTLCWVTMRNEMSPLLGNPGPPPVLVPTGSPNTYMFIAGTPVEKPAEANPLIPPPISKPSARALAKAKEDEEGPKIPAYHWKALDNRYIYYARGKSMVTQHLDEMGGPGWKGIEAIADRCEAGQEKRNELNGRARREQTRVRKALGFDDEEDYERLINISEVYSNTLRRFHRHILRIYSPAFSNLARLPSTFTDGKTIYDSTQGKMVGHIYTKLTDGSGLKLGQRLIESTTEVLKRLTQGKGGEGGSGGLGGFGGGLGGGGGASPM